MRLVAVRHKAGGGDATPAGGGQVDAEWLRYYGLRPSERLRMLLEAYARDDAGEAARLTESCPRYRLTGPDPSYEARATAARLLAMGLAGHLHYLCGKLEVLTRVDGCAEESCVVAAELVGGWLAWDAFCVARLEVSGDVALRAWGGEGADHIRGLLKACDGVRPDGQTFRHFADFLERGWRHRTDDYPEG